MARISDLTYQKLAWCTNWYIRDETLKAATTRLVNFQYHQPPLVLFVLRGCA